MELSTTLRRQDGLITRRQALAAGLSRGAIEHRLRRGRWQAVVPGIYATFSGQLTTSQRWKTGLLYGGPNCLLGGSTAARLHGLLQVPGSRAVHLLLPHGVHRPGRAFVRIRRTTAMPAPDYLDGLRTVPVARAVVDACRELTALNLVRALVAESVQQRKTTVTALSAELIKGGSAGSGLTRAMLLEVAAGSHSVAEAVGRDLLLRSALPPPEWMTSHGLLVVHVPPRRLQIEATEVLETLARTIAQGLGRPTPAVTDVAPLGWYRSL